MVSNTEIGRLFNLYAELLLLHGKDERFAGLLSGAAYRIRKITGELVDLSRTELNEQFRSQVTKLILELKEKGSISALDDLIQLTPTGLFELMRIKGLGGKKLSLLWKKAKIDTLEGLQKACKQDRLISIPGFGAKTQQNILSAIEVYSSNKDRFHFAGIADAADFLVTNLQKVFRSKLISLCGEIRRKATTVPGIEIITAIGPKQFRAPALRKLMLVKNTKGMISNAHTLDEIPVVIHHVGKHEFVNSLFQLTGSDSHVKKVLKKIKTVEEFKTEESIYKAAKLPFIVPELREDLAEWDYAKGRKELICLEDIKGVVHNHTTWSDGIDELDAFAKACKNRGYEYVVISDHSKNAHYAGGLNEEKILAQFKDIAKLNKKLSPFHVFRSIECDILVSGALDFSNDFLKKFDMVIISIHQLLKMDEKKATARLIKAIENPYTTILGHMTGRKLLIRPGYPVNFKKVIDACAANNVVIEINANPYRLDMDWGHIPYALSKGVMISVNPDAHSIAEIDNIKWGIAAARKGGLTKEMTWNAQPLSFIRKWIKR